MRLEMANLNSWSQLPFKQRMQMVDYWTVIIILSNVFHVIACLTIVMPDYLSQVQSEQSMMGFGTFLCWITLIKYL